MNIAFAALVASLGSVAAPPRDGAIAVPPEAPPKLTAPELSASDNSTPELSPKERLLAFRRAFDAGLTALGDETTATLAVESFSEALRLDPESAEAAYNLGLALATEQAFAEAADAFAKAAAHGDAVLAGQAMFNQGNARYAGALAQLKAASEAKGANGADATPPAMGAAAPTPTPPPATAPKPEEIIAALERALQHYKDAAAALPGDRDPRANAERTRKLIDELKRQQEQQQKQEQEQEQKSDEQQKQDQQQKSDQQQKQDQQQKSDQQQKQDQQQKSDEQQKQDQQQKSDQQQKQDQQQKSEEQQKQDQQQKSEEQQKQDQQQKSDQQPATGEQQPSGGEPPASAQRIPMTRDEMERLLQAVRDREHARRARIEAAKPQRRGNPGGKDW